MKTDVLYNLGDEAPLHHAAVNFSNRCLVCGRRLSEYKSFYFVVDTAWMLVDPNTETGTQGSFPIGQECAKKFDQSILVKIGA